MQLYECNCSVFKSKCLMRSASHPPLRPFAKCYKLKSYSKEEIRVMKRSQLRELAKSAGVTAAGKNADVADQLISKFEDLHHTESDVMIAKSLFYFAFKRFPERTDYNAAYHRINGFILDFFDDVDVFVAVIGVHEGLEMVGLKPQRLRGPHSPTS